jgi:hypothetical protein
MFTSEKRLLKFFEFVLIAIVAIKTADMLPTKYKDMPLCVIKSCSRPNEYLYAAYEMDSSFGYFKKQVFANEINKKYASHSVQAVWILEKVDLTASIDAQLFYLGNLHFENQFLCASNRVRSNKDIRNLEVTRINKTNMMANQKCMWRFEREKEDDPTSPTLLWNILYRNENLQVDPIVSNSASLAQNRKRVGLTLPKTHMENENSSVSSDCWFVDCQTSERLHSF